MPGASQTAVAGAKTGRQHALTDILDRLQHLAETEEELSVQHLVDEIGASSFPALMLVFALLAVSPASAIPGVTTLVAAAEFLLIVQMIGGKRRLWLPQFVSRRRLESDRLSSVIAWLRKPLGFFQRLLKARLTALVDPPWIYLPLMMILGLTLLMPFMEVIPASGSIAGAIISLFAAGLLTRDGVVVGISLAVTVLLPLLAWQFLLGG